MISSTFYQSLFMLAVLVLSLQNVSAADSRFDISKQERERVALMNEFGVSTTALKRSYKRLSDRLASKAKNNNVVKNRNKLGYLILALGDKQEILASLKRHNDTDLLALKRAPFSGRISLGVFNSLESAERRRKMLATYSVESEIVDRKTSRTIEI